jgi:DNA-binding beta-propeller fold protein YncE
MKRLSIVLLTLATALAGAATRIVQDQCGPFTDVSPAICPYVFEIYVLGITAGTSPTTYSPDAAVTRGQAAVFVSKGVNQSIARSSRRAALGQWWTTKTADGLGRTTVSSFPSVVKADGQDVWVADASDGTVSRVRGSDGRLLEAWTDAGQATDLLVAMGKVFVLSYTGVLSMIDPRQPPGAVTPVASGISGALAMAFDGTRIWTVGDTVSIVTPGATIPWAVVPITIPYTQPLGIVYDGQNIWLTVELISAAIAGELLKLDANGAVLQTTLVGHGPRWPVFDGANLWVLNGGADQSISVVHAATGTVLATLTGNGMSGGPYGVAFDGERVLVSSFVGLSLWSAADLAPAGFLPTGDDWPLGICSDGINFWVALSSAGQIARF